MQKPCWKFHFKAHNPLTTHAIQFKRSHFSAHWQGHCSPQPGCGKSLVWFSCKEISTRPRYSWDWNLQITMLKISLQCPQLTNITTNTSQFNRSKISAHWQGHCSKQPGYEKTSFDFSARKLARGLGELDIGICRSPCWKFYFKPHNSLATQTIQFKRSNALHTDKGKAAVNLGVKSHRFDFIARNWHRA